MGSKVREEQQRLKTLLVDTVTLLCKSGLTYRSLRVQGLLGVTVNEEEVFVVHLNELHQAESEVSTSSVCQDSLSIQINSDSELNTTQRDSPKITRRKRPSTNSIEASSAKCVKHEQVGSSTTHAAEEVIVIKSEPCESTGASSQQTDTVSNVTQGGYGLDLGLSNHGSLSSDWDNSQQSTDNDINTTQLSPGADTIYTTSQPESDPPYITGIVCNAKNDTTSPMSWIAPVNENVGKQEASYCPEKAVHSAPQSGSTPAGIATRVKRAKQTYDFLLERCTVSPYDLGLPFQAPHNAVITNTVMDNLTGRENIEEGNARDACQRFFKNMKDELQRFRSGKKGRHMIINKRNNRRKRKLIRRQECVQLLPGELQEKAMSLLSFKELVSSEESEEDEEGGTFFTVLQQGFLSSEAQEIKNLLDKAYNDKNTQNKNIHSLKNRTAKMDSRCPRLPDQLQLPLWMINDEQPFLPT